MSNFAFRIYLRSSGACVLSQYRGNIAPFRCLSTLDVQSGLIRFSPSGEDNDDTIRAEMHKNIKMHENRICLYSGCVTLIFANPVLFFQNLKQTLANNWGK